MLVICMVHGSVAVAVYRMGLLLAQTCHLYLQHRKLLTETSHPAVQGTDADGFHGEVHPKIILYYNLAGGKPKRQEFH